MPAPSKMREIEEREGRPMVDILNQLYAQHGTQQAVADALGISQGTLNVWLLKLGLVQKTVLTPEKKEGAA